MLKQLLKHLKLLNTHYRIIENNRIISSNKFDFTKGKGTMHAIYNVLSNIQPAFTKKKFGICIFADFSKAFYTVDHNTSLNRLGRYGIQGPPLSFIQY